MASSVQRNQFVAVEGSSHSAISSPVLSWIFDLLECEDTDSKYLIQNPSAVYSIVISYILFVKVVGPFVMRNRKPFDLKNVMIAYNISNAILSFILAVQMSIVMYRNWDERCDIKNNEKAPHIIKNVYPVIWLWFLNKIYDLVDTLFFVLRKKNNHVSVLHVFHHAGLVIFGFSVIKFHAYAFCMLIGVVINSLIHVLMYSYYAMAAFGPHMQKYLWWKKYMTQMQIIQFVIILSYMGHGFATGCELIETNSVVMFSFVSVILVLFLNFYRNNYKHHQS